MTIIRQEDLIKHRRCSPVYLLLSPSRFYSSDEGRVGERVAISKAALTSIVNSRIAL